MSNSHIEVTPELDRYLKRVSLREHPALLRLREDTAQLQHGSMQITPELGQFFTLLVRLMSVRRAVEIGTFTGYSATSIALGLAADGKLICCDASEEWTNRARQAWLETGVADRVELRLGPAVNTLDAMLARGESGTFDFAFIDADKTNYGAYLERVHALLRPGGLCVIDNVLWHGRLVDPDFQDPDTVAVRAFNEALAGDDRFSISLLPVGDGITLALKLR
jgi:O-methyltransferase